jgi:hypothetical protein
VLFGVPNRGLKSLSLMAMVKGQPNEQLVASLRESSRYLSHLNHRFRLCLGPYDTKIISVYETKETASVEVSTRVLNCIE